MTTIPLPPPASLSMPLEEAIRRRCSNRSISEAPLSDEELSALLWACAGQGRDGEHRTTPSTRGLKSDLAYVLRADGVWLYDEAANALVQAAEDDVRLASTEAQGDWVGRRHLFRCRRNGGSAFSGGIGPGSSRLHPRLLRPRKAGPSHEAASGSRADSALHSRPPRLTGAAS